MRTLLNIIWLVLSGFWLAIGYALAGVVFCVLILTIPFGVASFRIAAYALWPFGSTIVRRPDAGAGSALGNLLWIILAGFWLAIAHVVSGIVLCAAIIGIPLGLANFKMVPISLTPLAARSSRSRGDARSADAHAHVADHHHVVTAQLTTPAAFRLAVHRDGAVGKQGLRVATGVDEVGELEELSQPDRGITDRHGAFGGHQRAPAGEATIMCGNSAHGTNNGT